MNRKISSTPLFFIMMPYLGISLLPSDVQPIALVLSLGALLYSIGTIKIDGAAILLSLLLFVALISFFINRYDDSASIMFDSRALFGYFTAPILYVYFYNYLLNRGTSQLVKVIDFAVVLIFFGFLLNVLGLTFVIQAFVNRSIFDETTAGARGLTSFFPEQSRIPTQAMFFAFFYLIAQRLNLYRACALLVMSALSASGQFFINIVVFITGMGWASVFNSIRYGTFRAVHMAYIAIGFLFLAGLIYAARFHHLYLIDIGFPRRGIEAFHEITRLDMTPLSDDLGFLYKLSGPIQGVSSVLFDPFSIKMGSAYYFESSSGLMEVYTNIIYDIFTTTLTPLPPRSYSIFGAWLSDFRIWGLMCTIIFTLFLGRRSVSGSSSLLIGIFSVLMFLFLFRSNTSDPTPWAAAAALAYVGGHRLNKGAVS